MRRLFWAIALGAFWFFWPPELFAEESNDPLEVAVKIRQCLNGDAALSIAPGATAPIMRVDGFTFVVWPSALVNRETVSTHLDLPDDLYTDPIVTIEIAIESKDREAARPTMNRVAVCGRQAVPTIQ